MKQKRALDPSRPAKPNRLYQGYNTFADAGRSSALTPAGSDSASNGSFVEVANVYFGAESVVEAMSLSASYSGLFDFSSEDARLAFVETFALNSLSVTVLVNASLTTVYDVNIAPPTLTAGPPSDMKAFFNDYGDSYVNQITTGSWFCAMYTFYALSEDEQQSVAAQLSGMGITEEGLLSGSAQANLLRCRQTITTASHFDKTLLGFSSPEPVDEENILDFANNKFAQLRIDQPVTFGYSVTGYETVKGMPATFQPIETCREQFQGGGPDAGLAQNYITLTSASNAVAQLKSLYTTYGYDGKTNDPKLWSNGNDIDTDRTTLHDIIKGMNDDPTQAYAIPTLKSLAYGSPALQIVPHTFANGGTGGNPFADADPMTPMTGSTLSSVTLWGVNHVHKISATYNTPDGNQHTFAHGGADGNLGRQSPALSLAVPSGPPNPDQKVERINSVAIKNSWDSNQSANIVEQINLATNLGNKLGWPNSEQPPGDNWAVWTPGENEAFIGFMGRTGNECDQLGLISATFYPASWSGASAEAKRLIA